MANKTNETPTSDNMVIYDSGRNVPKEAIKPILGGRLKGMSNINSMWRIKRLTEIFGPVGFGWAYRTVREWTYEGPDGAVVQHVMIELRVKVNDVWSEPIEGVGGACLVAIESGGKRTDDEALKKATTDALSVACKNLGIGADVYFAEDRGKYATAPAQAPAPAKPAAPKDRFLTKDEVDKLFAEGHRVGKPAQQMLVLCEAPDRDHILWSAAVRLMQSMRALPSVQEVKKPAHAPASATAPKGDDGELGSDDDIKALEAEIGMTL